LSHKDCKWFRGAINIDQFYSHETFDIDELEEMNEGKPVFRDIYFRNIKLETQAGNAVYMPGLPESYGACHIQYYHLAKVGKESAIVAGQSNNQFRYNLSRADMSRVAGGKPVKLSNGNYKAKHFDISLNQYVRVIYYEKVENKTKYKIVVTMYPYK